MTESTIGQRVPRKEDLRFITGRGQYTDDVNVPNQTRGYFVRAPIAHGNIRSINTSAAENSAGVVAVLTGKDLAEDGLGPLPCGWAITNKDGSDFQVPDHPAIANDKVVYVGEPVALVIADTYDTARAAADLVEVDYEELDAVVDLGTAQQAPAIHENVTNNTSFEWELGNKDETLAAFENAPHVSTLEVRNNRLIPNAMEPRACLADYNTGSDELTLYSTSQNPHLLRLVLTAFVGLAPEHKLRVIAPDVGGGFGSKIFVYSEETACAWASKKLGVPIKWTAERSESFLADAHGRDHITTARVAMDDDGHFLALHVKTLSNMGGYMSTFSSAVPTYLYGTLLAGQYKTPNIYVEVDAVITNTAPVDAYRGAGRPEATYILERLVETAARDMNLDPAEIRRRNFIAPDQFPYQTPVVLEYDTGNYEPSLDKALELSDYAGFDARRAEAEGRGKLRGIGLSCYIEACGIAPSAAAGALGAGVGGWESAEVRFNPTGTVAVLTGAHSHGQGHETTFAQLVAGKLGVPVDDVEVVHGDTGKMDFGMGTYGSRSLAVGGSALFRASEKVIEKGRKIAAYMMDTTPDQIDFDAGEYKQKNSNNARTIQEVAFAAYVPHDYPLDELEPGLTEKAFYDPANFTFPAGAYVCEVEIDKATGVTEIIQFIAVDDFGSVINPMIVEGQVHGGIAQGVGQALLENCVYDESGQLQTGSYMDYCMPRADDLPSFVVDMTPTDCTHNPLGVKGCGEAGAIGSPPAVINAITNAIGVRDITMPATPEKVWRTINGQESAA